MVADDDADVRAALIESVATLGYRTVQASDGSDALAKIASGEQVDVVLSDYLMPNGPTGRDLGRRLSELRPRTKVVLVPATSPPEKPTSRSCASSFA
jgi:CheY-like chemotaxis protein